MDSWKTLAIALLASFSMQAVSGDGANPIAAAIFLTISAPTILIGATTSLTTDPPKIFKSAKTDALAFIGSDGVYGEPSLNKPLGTIAPPTPRR